MSNGRPEPQAAPPDFKFSSLGEEEVRRLGERLAQRAQGGEIFLLQGPLGAGKTFFARSFAAGLGVRSGVSSPTYVIHCEHPTPRGLVLHHLDFYRLPGEDQADDLGLEELCHPGAIVLAEWPDRCPGAFESFTLKLRFTIVGDAHRELEGWWGELPFDHGSVQDLLQTHDP